ncbi:MAG: T9SS type A sorting domain-containing protein [Lewinellaceae bacterium]|nr:T9SS type A sorting domain-containing protein [Lewinellaceae bacterium]
MQKLWLLVIASSISVLAEAQSFYNVTFNDGFFPAGWSANDSRVFVIFNSSAQSCCYSSSPTSPEASAEENVIFQHCQPTSSTVTLTVANVINTIGKTNIRVGFGRRATNAWNRELALEWSSDGSNWNLIDSDVSAGANTAWGSVYYDLPSGAENVANLRFRFSYVTATNATCDVAAPNFRIDDFTVGSDFSLPIELTRFEAKQNEKGVQLDWATATETNNDYFAVEHSTDGRQFATIGQVAGFGTTQLPQQYTFRHRQPSPGTNYYRLRQVDWDGSQSYSVLRLVTIEGSRQIHLYPSPAAGVLNVERFGTTENAIQYCIYNTLGGQMHTGNIPPTVSKISLPVDQLPPGKYLLQIRGEQQFSTLPFIKL